jgi:hypothetical protein
MTIDAAAPRRILPLYELREDLLEGHASREARASDCENIGDARLSLKTEMLNHGGHGDHGGHWIAETLRHH